MPGQPAWTLTEMLESNLPLCWAGGGDCNVGPAQIFRRPNFFSLKPIRAIGFNIKPRRCACSVFFGSAEEQTAATVFFLFSFFAAETFLQYIIFPAIREI